MERGPMRRRRAPEDHETIDHESQSLLAINSKRSRWRSLAFWRNKILNCHSFAIFNLIIILGAVFLLFKLTSVLLLFRLHEHWQGALLVSDNDGTLPESVYTSQELRLGACELHPPENVDWTFLLQWRKPDAVTCAQENSVSASYLTKKFLWFKHERCDGGVLSYRLHDGLDSEPWTIIDEEQYSIPIEAEEQVLVKCERRNKETSFDFHVRVVRNRLVIEAAAEARRNHANDVGNIKPQLNVLLIMIDSLSREHALRTLPDTLRFLRRLHLGRQYPFELFDYSRFNTVGRGTKTNFGPVIFGLTAADFENTENESNELPETLLSIYGDAGFITAYAEEDCCENEGSMGRILGKKAYEDYEKEEIPLFKRLFRSLSVHSLGNVICEVMQEMKTETFFSQKTREKMCFGGKFIHSHILDYLFSFFSTYSVDKTIAGSLAVWQCNIAHEASYMRVAQLDKELNLFLRWYTHNVPNAAVILMGDHGLGYGSISSTPTIQFEYNLPPLFMLMPEGYMRSLAPSMAEAMRDNQKKLVSGMDLHATLIDLLSAHDEQQATESGSSFLRPIEDRSCKSLGIPVTQCSCATFANEAPDKLMWQTVSRILVETLRQAVIEWPECLKVELRSIDEVRIVSDSLKGDDKTDKNSAVEIDLKVEAHGAKNIHDASFVFTVTRSPKESVKSDDLSLISLQVGTSWSDKERVFKDSEGIIFGVPSSLWFVFHWIPLEHNLPDRKFKVELMDSNNNVVKSMNLAVTSDWATSWHHRNMPDTMTHGQYKVRVFSLPHSVKLIEYTLDIIEDGRNQISQDIFDAHWTIVSTIRRSAFNVFTLCLPPKAPADKCICDKQS